MKDYSFLHVGEVRICDGTKRTAITVDDDRLDELRPFSQAVSAQEHIVNQMDLQAGDFLAAREVGKLQGMIELYTAIMMNGKYHMQTWEDTHRTET